MKSIFNQMNKINDEESLNNSLKEAAARTYKYPAGSPILKFNKDIGSTTADVTTTAVSATKAASNIVYKIKRMYDLTGSVVIDKSKLIVVNPSKPASVKSEDDFEQLSIKI